MWKQCIWAGLALLLLGCGESSDDRFETVTKLKILGVRAESPELHPGRITRVDVLMAAPEGVSVTTSMQPFAADLVEDFGQGDADFTGAGRAFQFPATASGYPCISIPGDDARCFPLALTRTGLEKPGVSNFYYEAPDDPGSFFIAIGAREGMLRLGAELDIAEETRQALKAIKEIRVRPEGETLNRNPEVQGAEVTHRWRLENADSLRPDKFPLPVEGMTVGKGEGVRVGLLFEDEEQDRVSATWWISSGSIQGFGRTDMDYIAPDTAGMVTVIGLLLDRKGGNNWWIQDLSVQPDEIEPDIGSDHPMLVRSAGRIFWMGFPDPSTAAAVATGLLDGESAFIEGDLAAHPTARLGWILGNPVPVDVAPADVTESTMTASDIQTVSATSRRVILRLDEMIESRF